MSIFYSVDKVSHMFENMDTYWQWCSPWERFRIGNGARHISSSDFKFRDSRIVDRYHEAARMSTYTGEERQAEV